MTILFNGKKFKVQEHRYIKSFMTKYSAIKFVSYLKRQGVEVIDPEIRQVGNCFILNACIVNTNSL